MRLVRRDSSVAKDPNNPDDYCQDEFEIHNEEDECEVRVDFKQFGRGSLRQHKFEVKVEWNDVRQMMTAFIEMGNSDAPYLQSLIRLGEAVEEAGWIPQDPPEERFSDILPESN